MNFSPREDLDFALRLAQMADGLALGKFRSTDLQVSTKPDLTPVTEADKAVEELLRRELSAHRPEDQIIGEEFGGDASHGRRWIIDPIDGTKNYVRGVPVWATLIALAEDDEILVGVVSAPAMGRRWWAAVGEGAHTRDVDGTTRSIHVSAVKRIEDASFSYSDAVGWERHGQQGIEGLNTLLNSSWRTRAYGDFWSHMLVAEGAVDIAAEPELAPWDVAALVAVVKEAGGEMTGYDGRSCLVSRAGLSTNGHLHDYALGLFNS